MDSIIRFLREDIFLEERIEADRTLFINVPFQDLIYYVSIMS